MINSLRCSTRVEANVKRIFFSVLLTIAAGCSALPKHYVELNSGTVVTLETILRQIENERVVFVGEIHGNPGSHSVQLEVIRYLHENGREVVIAIEVVPATKQKFLDRWINGNISRETFSRFFYDTVRIPYRYYESIFEYAREKRIPVAGIDAESKFISDVSKYGAKSVPFEFLEKIRFTDCSADPGYARVLRFSGERQYHTSGFPYLCNGQRMRDAVMAYNIANILKDSDVAVVVLTGTAHALKLAVPQAVNKHIDVSFKVLLPGKTRSMIERNIGHNIADYVWY